MKKAVITILGVISCRGDKESRAKYEISNELKGVLNLKDSNYTNMLPIVIENFYPEYDIIPVYTMKKDNKFGSKEILIPAAYL